MDLCALAYICAWPSSKDRNPAHKSSGWGSIEARRPEFEHGMCSEPLCARQCWYHGCSLTCLLQGTDLLSKQDCFLVQVRRADLVLSRSGPETKSMFIQFFKISRTCNRWRHPNSFPQLNGGATKVKEGYSNFLLVLSEAIKEWSEVPPERYRSLYQISPTQTGLTFSHRGPWAATTPGAVKAGVRVRGNNACRR